MAEYNNYENIDNHESEDTKDTFELLDRIENLIKDARNVPFSSNIMLNQEEVLMLLGMVKDSLPGELRQSKWLVEQSRELLETAREQADNIIDDAQHEVQQMIDEHEITQQARMYAQDTIDEANATAAEIQDAAISYTEKRLTALENQLTDVLVTIRKHKTDLQNN